MTTEIAARCLYLWRPIEMLELSAGPYRVEIDDDPTYSVGSADNVHTFEREYLLEGVCRERVTSRHGVHVTADSQRIASCIVLASGGPTRIHSNSAFIHANCCILAIGPFIVSLSLPSLELNWATETDSATCFGVYHSTKHRCLISHGELEIARLSHEGKIAWQTGGADIFTNGFTLGDDVVDVVDWNDQHYRIDIETGREAVR